MHPRLSGHALDLRVPPERTLVLDHSRVRDSGEKCSTLTLGTRRTNSRNAQTDTTIVIPTFNESANIGTLVERLSDAFRGRSAEILFVDDSTDDTPERIARAAAESRLPVRMIHRERSERTGGLAGAVKAGVLASAGEFVLVMDGDLQHPPEVASLLRDAAQEADLSVASRYVGAGDLSGLRGHHRRLVSSAGTVVAQVCFPWRVGRLCSDPMSGFFCFRRSSVDMARLRPRGFKILLEILASHDLRVRELPFSFGERLAGSSKVHWRHGVDFIRQLAGLRMGRMSRFAAVGVLGTMVNLGVMALLVYAQMVHYVAASLIAAEVSILCNFWMQERFVFRDVRGGSTWRRLGQHLLFNNVEALLRLPLLVVLVQGLHVPPVLGQAVTLGAAFLLRFLFMSRVVYRPPRASSPTGVVAGPPGALTQAESIGLPVTSHALRARYAARLILPPLAMAVAFPHAVSAVVHVDSFAGVTELVVVGAAAAAMVAMRAYPATGEPDVHDRQLDLIAGVPLLAASAWLSTGGPPSISVNQFTSRDVMAASAFLAGASFLLLGTRVVMRLRWVLWLPLLALPVVTEHVLIAVPLVVVVVLAAAVPLLRRPPAGGHAARAAVPLLLAFVLAGAVPLLRRRPAGGHATRVGRRREPGGTQRLPRLWPAGAFVLVLACILCVSNLPLVPYLVSLR